MSENHYYYHVQPYLWLDGKLDALLKQKTSSHVDFDCASFSYTWAHGRAGRIEMTNQRDHPIKVRLYIETSPLIEMQQRAFISPTDQGIVHATPTHVTLVKGQWLHHTYHQCAVFPLEKSPLQNRFEDEVPQLMYQPFAHGHVGSIFTLEGTIHPNETTCATYTVTQTNQTLHQPLVTK
ncbi:hypothetical protein [Bacillus fonticola]|uniref:hypothetical protein n=1 Tax=Bacillus fonticola TaxID=2728853 RepID=UPI0014729A26|nr:hypothetical protein [Bacillus fonticola]